MPFCSCSPKNKKVFFYGGNKMTQFTEDIVNSDGFKKQLKREVDMANKRLKRADPYISRIYKEKFGLEKISRKGGFQDKMKALSMARQINDDNLMTKRGFDQYVAQQAKDLRLSKKEVRYMISQIDNDKLGFVSGSKLKYGSNPQVDFLYDDFIATRENLENSLDLMAQKAEQDIALANEIDNEIDRTVTELEQVQNNEEEQNKGDNRTRALESKAVDLMVKFMQQTGLDL